LRRSSNLAVRASQRDPQESGAGSAFAPEAPLGSCAALAVTDSSGQDLELSLHLLQQQLQEELQEELLEELREELQEEPWAAEVVLALPRHLLQQQALQLPQALRHAGRCRHGLSWGTVGSKYRRSRACRAWDTATRAEDENGHPHPCPTSG
jgi:hypothetical protein